MSIWADIHQKSLGGNISKEDFSLIYTGENKSIELQSDEYKGNKYSIYTSGSYPYIKIIMNQQISVFSGYQLVKLRSDDGTYYDLDRVANGNEVGYAYFFNKDDDYVEGQHDGKKYSIEMIKTMTEKFIDLILESEKRLGDNID